LLARDLITDLGRDNCQGPLDRRMRVELAPRVLIVDRSGCLPLDDLRATIIFQTVVLDYERGSIILISNKSYDEWTSNFLGFVQLACFLMLLKHL
jgi:DNA replication protein DnaC